MGWHSSRECWIPLQRKISIEIRRSRNWYSLEFWKDGERIIFFMQNILVNGKESQQPSNIFSQSTMQHNSSGMSWVSWLPSNLPSYRLSWYFAFPPPEPFLFHWYNPSWEQLQHAPKGNRLRWSLNSWNWEILKFGRNTIDNTSNFQPLPICCWMYL